ncbi:MAG: HD domain-containing protein [Planctomycetota bacterium]|jgi:(p)ppGpp synthase/HD superfamily hydrolase
MQHHDVLRAVAFAARVHAGQLRKDGKTPYVSHVVRVCMIVRNVFGFDDPRMLQTALLHDTIEDTTTDFDDIAEAFSTEVAAWTAALTKDKRLGEAAREAAYLQALLGAPWQVHVCKLADIYDNLLDSQHLDAAKQAKTRERAHAYLEGFRGLTHAEVVRCRNIVDALAASVAENGAG